MPYLSTTNEELQILENLISDSISNLLFYDRKEDEDLPLGRIEKLVLHGVITPEEIITLFGLYLMDGLGGTVEKSHSNNGGPEC